MNVYKNKSLYRLQGGIELNQSTKNFARSDEEIIAMTENYRCELETLYGFGEPLPDTGNWLVDRDGVRTTRELPNGGVKVVTACRAPLAVTKLIENAETGLHGVELAFKLRGMWHFIECARSEIADRSRIIQLADRGLPVTSETARAMITYLDDFIACNLDFIRREQSINRLGWFRGCFIPYSDSIRLAESSGLRGVIRSAGSLRAWREHVVALLDGNTMLRLYLAASFASAIIEPLGLQNFVAHLWGRTGSGKSVALMLAASVWGEPDGRLFGTMNGTLNYMQSQAAALRSVPLCLDELQTVRDSFGNYDKLIMQLGVGVGRGRADRDGSARKTNEWHNTALFTGEEPLLKPESGAGAVNRVLQLCVDDLPGNIISNGGETVAVIKENYGVAGAMFVSGLLRDGSRCDEIIAALRGRYKDHLSEILQAAPTSGKQAAILAALLAADEFAEITVYHTGNPLTPRDVMHYALTSDDISKPRRAMDYTLNMISVHQNDFQGVYRKSDGTVSDGWGHQPGGMIFGKLTDSAAYINKSVLVRWLEEGGYSFDAVKKEWAQCGFLQKNAAGKYCCSPPKGMSGSFIKLNLRNDPKLPDIT